MRQAIKTFVAVLVFGSTLVGAYLGALAVHLVWAFWLIVPVAAAASLARVTTPRLLDLLTRIRNYPKLLRAAAASELLVSQAKVELAKALQDSTRSYAAGVVEGRAQAIGSVLAAMSRAEIRPEAVSTGNGLQIHGRLISGSLPLVETRLALQVTATEEIKGVVQVIKADSEDDLVVMICVARLVEEFWQHLEQYAIGSPRFPDGFRLISPSLEIYTENNKREQNTSGN